MTLEGNIHHLPKTETVNLGDGDKEPTDEGLMQFMLLCAVVNELKNKGEDPRTLALTATHMGTLNMKIGKYSELDAAIIGHISAKGEGGTTRAELYNELKSQGINYTTLMQRIRRLLGASQVIYGENELISVAKTAFGGVTLGNEADICSKLELLKFNEWQINYLRNLKSIGEGMLSKYTATREIEGSSVELAMVEIVRKFLFPIVSGESSLREQIAKLMPFLTEDFVKSCFVGYFTSLNPEALDKLISTILSGVLDQSFYTNTFPVSNYSTGNPHRLIHHFLSEILYRDVPYLDDINKKRKTAKKTNDPVKRKEQLSHLEKKAVDMSRSFSRLRLVARIATAISMPPSSRYVIMPDEIISNGTVANLRQIDEKTAEFISSFFHIKNCLPPGFMLLLSPRWKDPRRYDDFVEYVAGLDVYSDHVNAIRHWADKLKNGALAEIFYFADGYLHSSLTLYRQFIRLSVLYGHMYDLIDAKIFNNDIFPALQTGYPNLDRVATMLV